MLQIVWYGRQLRRMGDVAAQAIQLGRWKIFAMIEGAASR
jgi:hypothetical protein